MLRAGTTKPLIKPLSSFGGNVIAFASDAYFWERCWIKLLFFSDY
jgi:hypothetical protein